MKFYCNECSYESDAKSCPYHSLVSGYMKLDGTEKIVRSTFSSLKVKPVPMREIIESDQE